MLAKVQSRRRHSHSIIMLLGQPTQRAESNKLYRKVSNIDTAQIFLHANGQRPKRAMIRQRSRARGVSRGAGSHTPSTASESFSHPPTLPYEKIKGDKKRSCKNA